MAKDLFLKRSFKHIYDTKIEYTAVFYVLDNESDILEGSIVINDRKTDLTELSVPIFDVLMADVHRLTIQDFVQHYQRLYSDAAY